MFWGKNVLKLVVTNKEKDRKIVYWITKGDYAFFIPMLKTLNRKENQALYYLEIEGIENHFPMLSTEYTYFNRSCCFKINSTKN